MFDIILKTLLCTNIGIVSWLTQCGLYRDSYKQVSCQVAVLVNKIVIGL